MKERKNYHADFRITDVGGQYYQIYYDNNGTWSWLDNCYSQEEVGMCIERYLCEKGDIWR